MTDKRMSESEIDKVRRVLERALDVLDSGDPAQIADALEAAVPVAVATAEQAAALVHRGPLRRRWALVEL